MEDNFSEMQTAQNRQIERIVMRTAEEKDSLIRNAITFILGDNWTIKSITGRCEIQITPDKREIFCLDGKPLLEFYPIETFIDHKDLGVSMKASQKYRKLYA